MLLMSEQSTLFMEGSLVSPLAWLETKKGKMMTDICGRSFRAWSQKLNRVGLSLRTYLEFCTSRLTQFVPIWSVKATASGFGILKLRLSERITGEKEYFLWRTPDAHCDRGASSRERYEMKLKEGLPVSLNDQVAHLSDSTASGSLNPEWIEWLMGFPIGWTDLERSETP